MFPICRTGRLVFTPVTSPFAECSAAFGWKRRVHPTQYSRLFLADWLSSGRVTLSDPSNRASFRNPRDLWLADRFNGDSFPLSSTLFGQLFHRQLLPLTATPIAIKLLGESWTPTSELRCPLLRIVSKGKCLSHQRCRVPGTGQAPMPVFLSSACSHRCDTCTLSYSSNTLLREGQEAFLSLIILCWYAVTNIFLLGQAIAVMFCFARRQAAHEGAPAR